jgi:GrpB-like predicted nucleotidyltransferase (UPF0157 family)
MPHLRVIPYDPQWPEQYEEERTRLLQVLGDVAQRIEHNGSTAVPGLAAKPVVDIQISVVALQPIDGYRIPLVRLGYFHVPHEDDAFCPFGRAPGVSRLLERSPRDR